MSNHAPRDQPDPTPLVELDDAHRVPRFDARWWTSRSGQMDHRLLLALLVNGSFTRHRLALRTLAGMCGADVKGTNASLHRCAEAGLVQVKFGERYRGPDQPGESNQICLTAQGIATLLVSPLGPVALRVLRFLSTTESLGFDLTIFSVDLIIIWLNKIKSQKKQNPSHFVVLRNRRGDPPVRLDRPLFREDAGGLYALILINSYPPGEQDEPRQHRVTVPELAQLLSLSVRQVHQILARWQRKGVILVEGDRLLVPAPTDLGWLDTLAGETPSTRHLNRGSALMRETRTFKEARAAGFAGWRDKRSRDLVVSHQEWLALSGRQEILDDFAAGGAEDPVVVPTVAREVPAVPAGVSSSPTHQGDSKALAAAHFEWMRWIIGETAAPIPCNDDDDREEKELQGYFSGRDGTERQVCPT